MCTLNEGRTVLSVYDRRGTIGAGFGAVDPVRFIRSHDVIYFLPPRRLIREDLADDRSALRTDTGPNGEKCPKFIKTNNARRYGRVYYIIRNVVHLYEETKPVKRTTTRRTRRRFRPLSSSPNNVRNDAGVDTSPHPK